MKQSVRKMISLNAKRKYWILSAKIQVLLWTYGLRHQWQKLSMQKILHMIAHLNRVSLSLIKIFLTRILVNWLRILLKRARLIKHEPRSSIQFSSIRTEAGFTQRSTKCVRIKEER